VRLVTGAARIRPGGRIGWRTGIRVPLATSRPLMTNLAASAPPLAAPAPDARPRARAARTGPLGFSWRMWLLKWAFWTVMVLLESAKSLLQPLPPGVRRPPPLLVVLGNVPWWYGWLLLTPLVLALARRFPPWAAGRTLRHAALHFALSIPIGLVHGAVGALGWMLIVRAPGAALPATAQAQVTMIALNFLMGDVMVYWALVGAYAALFHHRRLRDRELETARLAEHAARLESSATRARLDALRMELNPHFLFNTLNSVSGLVRRRENDAAVEVLAALGDLLRITLGQREQQVPLELELDFLQRYLKIERTRFHDRLSVEVDVPDELRHLPVPSLVLQPLVENAVRHGVAKSPGPGRVTIRAFPRGGELVLEVSDTGAGFVARRGGGGVGLQNTRERLARLYGGRARLELGSAPGGGARVTVAPPMDDDGAGAPSDPESDPHRGPSGSGPGRGLHDDERHFDADDD
jgi:two-component system, LytTR family, sensor kinase